MAKAPVQDPVTRYAAGVVAREIVASRLVRQACQRHLDDLRDAAAKGLEWRPASAQEPIDFFAEVLYLPENTDAEDSAAVVDSAADDPPRPFVLAPWQAFIVGSLFGWYTAQGFRRFREAYIETSKGAGKTPLGAGIMLYLLVADGERGAQVFLAAVSREQAGYAWKDCRAMVNASPELLALFGSDGFRANEMIVPGDNSYLRPVSSEKRGLDGKRVHGALVDELHEHATPMVVNKMRAGTKGRRNALIVKTTNSGFDRASVCWNHHEYSRKVLDGTVANETWFAFICGIDPCDACAAAGKWFPSDECPNCDDWKVEGPHWLKANPNLGVSLPWQYVRERVAQAKGMPTEVSDVLRFNFCVWTQGSSRAIDMGHWAACPNLPSEADLLTADCFGCLDLGETDDFSAWGKLWVLRDGRVAVKMKYWLPDVALERYPNRPYDAWKRLGILDVTEGDVTDYATIRAQILKDYKALGMSAVFYDTKTARETAQMLMGEGVEMVPMTQGFALNEAVKRLLELIVSGQMCHEHEPILGFMASNTVVIQSGDKRRIDKQRSPEKIDGIAALVMGIEGALVRRERTPGPQYQAMIFGGRR
jgi:phage terminase large subunit-like protein